MREARHYVDHADADHHPGAVSLALLTLGALILVLDRLGLIVWIPWLDRRLRDGSKKHLASAIP